MPFYPPSPGYAKKENPTLVKKYGFRGFSTAFILDGDGKKDAQCRRLSWLFDFTGRIVI